MIESVVATLKEQPRVSKLMVEGDLNVKLSKPEGYQRGEQIAEDLTRAGLEGK